MERIKKTLFILFIAGLLIGGYYYYIHLQKMRQGSQQGPIPVMVTQPVKKSITRYLQFTGRAEAVEAVDIQARVEGYLQKVAFKDGAMIRKGDLLFEIEPDAYQAVQDMAKAKVSSAEAKLASATQDYQRVQLAIKDNAVSEQEVSSRKADMDIAAAAVNEAKAALVTAGLNLGYAKIFSPIDGKISRRYVDVGNLVGTAEKTLLAKIVRLDPVYVYFYASENQLIEQLKYGSTYEKRSDYTIGAGLGDNNSYPYRGKLDYMDSVVDPSTGTVQVRGVLDNPDKQILPGMFVRVQAPVGGPGDVTLVLDKAIGTDLGGKYVYIVKADNTIEQHMIKVAETYGEMRIVESGLSGEESYITTGMQYVKPGMSVKPMTADTTPKPEQNPIPDANSKSK
jgi:multidrug efflux system membrane fusion protein